MRDKVNFCFLTHDITDPYFNLASEEYLLMHKDGYFFYVWVNDPAVIVGVNQNAIEEVNLGYAEKEGIKIVRRLTGGGAVYHDGGNICYTVIAPYGDDKDYYREFTKPVIEYLNGIGVPAEFSGRNDITVLGKKISGNAQTVKGNKIMHHGTILFDTDGEVLSKVLKPNKLKMESKGIKSVRARVTNVAEVLRLNGKEMSFSEFKKGLVESLSRGKEVYALTDEDINAIRDLEEKKYSTWGWNIGASPKGKNLFEARFPFGTFSMYFDTVEGKMKNVNVFGDFFSTKDVGEFAGLLENTPYTPEDIKKAFGCVGEYIKGADAESITEKIFE